MRPGTPANGGAGNTAARPLNMRAAPCISTGWSARYQREYYKNNKKKINKKRQIDEAIDPEKIERRLSYNRTYYKKHRKRLLGMRAERYRKMKTLQNKDTKKSGLQNLT